MGYMSEFLNIDVCVFQSPKIAFILTNSADPDKMSHSVAFHLCLHCLLRISSDKASNLP